MVQQQPTVQLHLNFNAYNYKNINGNPHPRSSESKPALVATSQSVRPQ